MNEDISSATSQRHYVNFNERQCLSTDRLDSVDRGSRTLAIYKDEHVWVEWKSYNISPDSTGCSQWDAAPAVFQNVERLVALLQAEEKPAEFCVPNCLGYFQDEDNERFGFVYKI